MSNLYTLLFDNEERDFGYRYAVGGRHARVLHTHTFYEFFVTLSDNVIHIVNGETTVLQNGMLVLMRPADEHCFEYTPQGGEPRHINLAFRESILDEARTFLSPLGDALFAHLLNSKLPPVCILTEKEQHHIQKEMNRFNVMNPAEHPELSLELRFFVIELLWNFSQRMQTDAENANAPKWLEAACDKMAEHENFSLGLPRMVELCDKSREHVARSMMRYKNVTVSNFINNLRLEYVANMLVNSNMNVVDLCYDSGFESLDYFGKLFKKKYGMTPTSFRKAIENVKSSPKQKMSL